MKLPKHYTLSIEHNPHKICYETVEKYIDHYEHLQEAISQEDLKICKERDELWQLQWYPDTPIGFHVILSYSLQRCLELSECEWECYDY